MTNETGETGLKKNLNETLLILSKLVQKLPTQTADRNEMLAKIDELLKKTEA